MFTNDSQKQAKDKLIILSLINHFNLPLTNEQIIELVMGNDLIDYFALQHYLSELLETSMIQYTESVDGNFYSITEMGKVSIEFFADRINAETQSKIKSIIESRKRSYVMETAVVANYTKKREDEYEVCLSIQENQSSIIDLSVNVISEKHAEDICKKWKSQAQFLYGDILTLLTTD